MDNLKRAIEETKRFLEKAEELSCWRKETEEAKRFLEKAEELSRWREETKVDPCMWAYDAEHLRLDAAMKRASMDLSKALSLLRR